MGMIKHYFLALVCVGKDQQEQDAIEYALYQDWFKPKYNFDADVAALTEQLPVIVEQFKRVCQENAQTNQPMQEFIDSIAAMNTKLAIKV
jgi:hypothetical protein